VVSSMVTLTTYTVSASFERDGQCLACNQAEVLGEAFGVTYIDRDEAQEAVDELTESLSDTDLDPSTTFGLDEQTYTIESIDIVEEYLSDDEEPSDLEAYIGLRVVVGGRGHASKTYDVGVSIGVRESDQGSALASGLGINYYGASGPRVWWTDPSDRQELPTWMCDWMLSEIGSESRTIWDAVVAER
jgi:hypothetical protein